MHVYSAACRQSFIKSYFAYWDSAARDREIRNETHTKKKVESTQRFTTRRRRMNHAFSILPIWHLFIYIYFCRTCTIWWVSSWGPKKSSTTTNTHTHTLRQKMLRIYMLIENHVLFGRNACDVNLPETEFSKQMLLMVKLFDYHHHKLSSVD